MDSNKLSYKLQAGLSCGFLFYLHSQLFAVTAIGHFASNFFKMARTQKQIISHTVVAGENSYTENKQKIGFVKSGVSYIEDTRFATNLDDTSIALIKSLHKINCLTPNMYILNLAPIRFEIDARNPVDEIQMCIVDSLTNLPSQQRKTLFKKALYNQVQNLGAAGTLRLLELEPPTTTCVVKLSVKSRGHGINIWFRITVHQGGIPPLFNPIPVLQQQQQQQQYQEGQPDVFALNETFDWLLVCNQE